MPRLHHRIVIEASPSRVYEAIATQAGLRNWWTADTQADERVGGKAEFGFDDRETVFRMTIEALEPGRRVSWRCRGGHPEWRGTRLHWRIQEHADGAELAFVHEGWRAVTPMLAICNSTWGELMHRLKAYVEGANPGPHWAL